MKAFRSFVLLLIVSLYCGRIQAAIAEFNVRDFGAKGDGVTLDTRAINAAIDAADAAGGGMVRLPAGHYLSFSIRLRNNIALYLDAGCTLLAAAPAEGFGRYDLPEPNEHERYQDFGHSHWQNSLLWGIGVQNVSILGSGVIDGRGLVRYGPSPKTDPAPAVAAKSDSTSDGEELLYKADSKDRPASAAGTRGRDMTGQGNKAISLKLCRNVTLRDFSLLNGGHMAVLASGVDNLTIDNLKIDTNRDGLDIDSCRQVRIANCSVNSPHDDGICLKSSFGLGEARACENVTITNCQVTGYDVGTFLDGTCKRTLAFAPDRDGPTGRIKCGTESNGGFKNITISNCVFDRSRGLALETVDGGPIEDVTISNIAMREVSNSPLFLRLGCRARGPGEPVAGVMRRISISNVVVSDADPRYASIIAGVPGHPIEDVRLNNIQIVYRGGITMAQVADQPTALTNHFFQRRPGQKLQEAVERPLTEPREPFAVPECEAGYPEPSMFGLLPAYGLFVRHAKNISVSQVNVSFASEDTRPAIVLMDVSGADFDHVRAQRASGAAFFELREVSDFTICSCATLPDSHRDSVTQATLK